MKCCECGKEIDHVLVNEFQRDGTDRYALRPLEDLGDDCYSVFTDSNWTGYGQETEDQLVGVCCPECEKFPFKTKDVVESELVQLTFWN